MGCVIDHLRADHRVSVLQDFRDARGAQHCAGEIAILRRMEVDWPKQEIALEWERDGVKERICFALAAKTGPGNGRMREYFALEEAVASLDESGNEENRLKKQTVPLLVEEPVIEPGQYEAAVARVWALAAAHRFPEAGAQIQLVLAAPDEHGTRLEDLAGDVVRIAVFHARDAEAAVFEWACEEGIQLWYAWGAQATSGGEGALKARSIRAVEQKLAECAARRVRPV